MFPKEKKLLPSNWKPSENYVLIAKGKASKKNPGNIFFQDLITEYLGVYSRCKGRKARANVISSIMTIIAQRNVGAEAFVKFDGHHYWEADLMTIRENISAAFRNKLSDKYNSSTKNKSAARRKRKADRRQLLGMSESADNATESLFMQVRQQLASKTVPEGATPSIFLDPTQYMQGIFNKIVLQNALDFENSVSTESQVLPRPLLTPMASSSNLTVVSDDDSVRDASNALFEDYDKLEESKQCHRRSNGLRESVLLHMDDEDIRQIALGIEDATDDDTNKAEKLSFELEAFDLDVFDTFPVFHSV